MGVQSKGSLIINRDDFWATAGGSSSDNNKFLAAVESTGRGLAL